MTIPRTVYEDFLFWTGTIPCLSLLRSAKDSKTFRPCISELRYFVLHLPLSCRILFRMDHGNAHTPYARRNCGRHPSAVRPVLPLYGIYGIIILKASKRLLKKPVFVFSWISLCFHSCNIFSVLRLNFFSGYKLWDFSEFFLNINGRIYLGGSAAFALLGCAFIYYLAPNWTNYFSKLSKKTQTVFCVILNSLFITDVILTLIFSY